MIPIFIHGDGVPVKGVGKSWGESCDIYNWGSLLASGGTVEITFLIWAVWCHSVVTGTKDLFWKILNWSLTALFFGRHPTHDYLGNRFPPLSLEGLRAGQPLVGAAADADNCFCGVLWVVKGDLDFDKKDILSSVPYNLHMLWEGCLERVCCDKAP